MPLQLSVGISHKIGLPNYSSVGASCHVQLELDGGMLFRDPETLQLRIQEAYQACRRGVEHELDAHRPMTKPRFVEQRTGDPQPSGAAASPENGSPAPNRSAAVSPAALTTNGDPAATERQLRFVKHLASQIRGLSLDQLEIYCSARFGTDLDDLVSHDASELIDLLKEVRAGNSAVDQLLEGAAA